MDTTCMCPCRVVSNAVQGNPQVSDANVAETLRGVLRNVSMGDEDFESAVNSLLRTLSSTSSQSSGMPPPPPPLSSLFPPSHNRQVLC